MFLTISLFCQEYNYVHYDVKDGLAGSTVYSMVQDKDGFMWYGTETGLSRFDGTHFKNFYTSDGLPDNEIIKLFVDSKNRVWIIPFKNSICYYYKGKIHNQENDSLLKQLKITEELQSILEDGKGNILIADKHRIYLIAPESKISTINLYKGKSFDVSVLGLSQTGALQADLFLRDYGHLWVKINLPNLHIDSISKIAGNNASVYLSPQLSIWRNQNSLKLIYSDDASFEIQLSHGFINVSGINDSIISFNTVNESYLFDIKAKKIVDTFSIQQTVNEVTQDTEGNLWFCVSGKGVYRLASGFFLNFFPRQQSKSVFCIQKFDSLIYAGSDNFNLWVLDINKRIINGQKIINSSTEGRITSLIKNDEKNIIAGTDNGIYRFETKMRVLKDSQNYLAVKSITSYSNKKIIVSTNNGVFLMKENGFNRDIDTIWHDRSTCAFLNDSLFYIGTLNGLYAVNSKKEYIYLGDSNKIFKVRINAINATKDGMLLIGTNGSGIVAIKNNKIIFNITEEKGLSSNNCRCIYVSSNAIWVGTDRGLNKISYSDDSQNIIAFTSTDGLSSDIINAIYADRNDIYVGTPEGLTYFNESLIAKKSICNLRVTSINLSGKQLDVGSSNFVLQHDNNNIEFQFVGISYKSGGKISYQYRLLGLDSHWRSTNTTLLNYTSLRSGKYELQLKAVNKFGMQSNLIKVPFAVAKTIWEQVWVRILMTALAVFFLWLIINYRITTIRKKENEKSETVRRISELEQMALKSQMNPHFIFNCLNSIQHYVIDKDIIGANEFISNFSKLIRLTLDNSSKQSISIADEISYISAYLELEQKRFEDKFTFVITSDGISKNNYFVPPMILQPYVENAIRHGIRYREDNKGELIIKFEKNQDYLVVDIFDNGIGRKLSQQLKGSNSIEYQSKGMDLTARRIEMFNKAHSAKIIININDLEDGNRNAIGTEVIIKFPIKEIEKMHSI